MLCGCTTCSASACAPSNYFWPSRASWSPTRPYGAGARNSASALPIARRRRRPRPGDKWHMDEVFIRIRGVQHCISGAPSIRMVSRSTFLVQARRDANAREALLQAASEGVYGSNVRRVIVTDKLRSIVCAAPPASRASSIEHARAAISGPICAENSHRPTRDRREYGRCNGLNRPSMAQDFLSASRIHSCGHFASTSTPHDSHRLPRSPGPRAFNVWQQETCAFSIRRDQHSNRPPGPPSPLEVNVTMPAGEHGLPRLMGAPLRHRLRPP